MDKAGAEPTGEDGIDSPQQFFQDQGRDQAQGQKPQGGHGLIDNDPIHDLQNGEGQGQGQ